MPRWRTLYRGSEKAIGSEAHDQIDWTHVRKSAKKVSMSANELLRSNALAEEPYEAALGALLADWRASGKCKQPDKALILALAAKISPHRRSVLLQGFERELASPSSRGGPVFENVIRLIDASPEWTAASLRRKLSERGHPVDAKTLSNCLNYLVKSGRLTRISRGHYAVAGFGVITSDELFPPHDLKKGGENED